MKRTAFFAILAGLSLSVADGAQSFIPGMLKEEYWQGGSVQSGCGSRHGRHPDADQLVEQL